MDHRGHHRRFATLAGMPPSDIGSEEVEGRVLNVLAPLNEALADLARRGVKVRLAPWGGVYEAHIYTGQGVVVLRPQPDDGLPKPANDPQPGS